jgi:hypothetical protein
MSAIRCSHTLTIMHSISLTRGQMHWYAAGTRARQVKSLHTTYIKVDIHVQKNSCILSHYPIIASHPHIRNDPPEGKKPKDKKQHSQPWTSLMHIPIPIPFPPSNHIMCAETIK